MDIKLSLGYGTSHSMATTTGEFYRYKLLSFLTNNFLQFTDKSREGQRANRPHVVNFCSDANKDCILLYNNLAASYPSDLSLEDVRRAQAYQGSVRTL